jgi:hypothetical protein
MEIGTNNTSATLRLLSGADVTAIDISATGVVTFANDITLDGNHITETHHGRTQTAIETITTGNWDKPQGFSNMINVASTGEPSGSSHGYYFITGRRDTGGGYGAIWQDYSSGQLWSGWHTTGGDPTWRELAMYDTSGDLDIPGDLAMVATSLLYVDSTRYLRNVTGSYGNVQVGGTGVGSWRGYNINTDAVFMSNGSTYGLYNDTNSRWGLNITHAGVAVLYYVSSTRITTTSAGMTLVGTGTATDWAATSDVRLKENIKYNESWKDRVLEIGKLTARYDWIDKDKSHPFDNIGFIAQDIQPIAPEFVDEYTERKVIGHEKDGVTEIIEENDYYTLNYNKMVAPLYAAFAEQQEEIEELKKLINTLINKK